MRASFRGYYRPTDAEFAELWRNAFFAFDTNTLLNPYRYTEGTRTRFIEILTRLRERIWLPYQAGLEFHKNRLDVISDQAGTYDRLSKHISAFIDKVSSDYSRHFAIDLERVYDMLKEAQTSIDSLLAEARDKHPNLAADDPVLRQITELVDGRVGKEPAQDELKGFYKEGEQRYKEKVPPGYEDAKTKRDNRQYGDFIIWKQFITHANDVKKPAIFVSDDPKDDWWWTHSGRTFGPRPELIEEFWREVGQAFWMYPTDSFMKYAQTHLGLDDQKAAIDEVREVRERSESPTDTRQLGWRTLLKPTTEAAISQLETQIRQIGTRVAIEEALLGDSVKAGIKRLVEQEAAYKALIDRAALLSLLKEGASTPNASEPTDDIKEDGEDETS
jgi:PIN like domain